jgi:hypothetical protein
MRDHRWFRQWAWRVLLSCVVLFQGASCLGGALGRTTDKVSMAFDNALASLGSQSDQWRATLQVLENDLIKQGQSTLANEVQTVLNRGIATASTEFRCDVKFLTTQLSQALRGILASYRKETPPPQIPHFCNIDPDSIDLRLTPDRRPATLNIYGFNLTATNVVAAVVNLDGSRIIPKPGIFNVATEFKATFNIVNYPFTRSSSYVSFTLPEGEERRVSITQKPDCGGVDQVCCSVGTACNPGAGCLSGRCATCPPPSVPQTKTIFLKGNEFAGNNCGGQNVDRTYGGMCDAGFHREQCALSVNDSCDVCTAKARWATSNPSDCTCIVHFNTPSDCFKGIHVDIKITETQNQNPRPAGCP